MPNYENMERAALWSFGKAWPHRFGNSGVRYHIRSCVSAIREARKGMEIAQ
jgi:hypothetical protein